MEYPYTCPCGRQWYTSHSPDGPIATLLGVPSDVSPKFIDLHAVPWWREGKKCLAGLFWFALVILWFLMALEVVEPSVISVSMSVFLSLLGWILPYVRQRGG
jgi:hypothetical protein